MSDLLVVDLDDLDALDETANAPAVAEEQEGQSPPRLPVLRVAGLVGSAVFAGAMSLTCFVC